MWTELHRKTYAQVGGRYPGDMTVKGRMLSR